MPYAPKVSNTIIAIHSSNKLNAGKDLIFGSFALKCITMAPSIKIAITLAAGIVISAYHMEPTKAVANKIFIAPIKYIIGFEIPYTSNSSFIDFAPPPL
jgi:hypothetical protein